MANGNGYSKFMSRKYQLAAGVIVLATALAWAGKLDGSEWVAAAVAAITQYAYFNVKESVAYAPPQAPPPAGG